MIAQGGKDGGVVDGGRLEAADKQKRSEGALAVTALHCPRAFPVYCSPCGNRTHSEEAWVGFFIITVIVDLIFPDVHQAAGSRGAGARSITHSFNLPFLLQALTEGTPFYRIYLEFAHTDAVTAACSVRAIQDEAAAAWNEELAAVCGPH